MTLKPSTKTTPEDFAHTITKVAVSQICQSVGYKGSNVTALNTLTTVATKYLQSLATSAASYAASANRTETNALDIKHALEDNYGIQGRGFRDGVLSQIRDFVRVRDEIPFVRAVPKMGLPQNLVLRGTECGKREKHVPEWLPGYLESKKEECVEDKKCDEELVGVEKEIMVVKCGELPKERHKVEFRIEVRNKRKMRCDNGEFLKKTRC